MFRSMSTSSTRKHGATWIKHNPASAGLCVALPFFRALCYHAGMLIFVYGDDALRVKERVDDMRTKFLEKFDPTGMNVSDVYVRTDADASPGVVFQAVQSTPFLAEKRMVVIRNLLTTVKKADAATWVDGFTRTPDSTIVVFSELASREKVEKTSLFGLLKGIPDVHHYAIPAMQGRELFAWLAGRAKSLGAYVAPGALDRLIERCGEETWLLDSELRKLAAYAGGSSIDNVMIELLTAGRRDEDVFGLLDVIARGNAAKALERLAQERAAGAEEFPLFGMVIRQIRLLLGMQLYLERTGKSDGAASALGIHPFVAQKIAQESRRHSSERLRILHRRAMELDKAMKRGLSPSLAVDRLVVELAGA